jgi:hypothetical protein
MPTTVNLPGFSWNLSASALTMSASGTAGPACGFSLPPSYFSRSGTVELTLTSPNVRSYVLTVSGSATFSGSGASYTSISGVAPPRR